MFLLRLLLITLIFGVLTFGSSYVIREYYKVEQHGWFSNNYVNDKHKRYDVALRISAIILILVGYVVNLSREWGNELWYFQPYSILFGSIFLQQIVRAMMEKQYIENENYYKATIAEAFVFIIVIFITYQTNFFSRTF